jgi:broad specificity phosphatase PhoE
VALGSLHAAFSGQHLIAVAHGGLIHSVLSELNGAPVDAILNTAVSLIEIDDIGSSWLIRAINSEMLAA